VRETIWLTINNIYLGLSDNTGSSGACEEKLDGLIGLKRLIWAVIRLN
jgi:hypothetical protein